MPASDVLGRNGTYVVFRKYHSHVAAFNRFLHEAARTEEQRELLVAKLGGRWRSGAPLALSPACEDPALGDDPHRINDFDYTDDPRGLRTPLGSHIRRMNPRATRLEVLSDVNIAGSSGGAPPTANHSRRRRSPTTARTAAWTTSPSAPARSTTSSSCKANCVNSGNFMGLGKEKDPLVALQDRGHTSRCLGLPHAGCTAFTASTPCGAASTLHTQPLRHPLAQHMTTTLARRPS